MKRFLALIFCVNILFMPACSAIIEDELVNTTLDKNLKIKPRTLEYESTETPVEIRIKKVLTTKTKPEEGDIVEFETVSDVKSYPAGTTVTGRIEFISMNYTYGVPADIIIGSFKIGKTPLYGEISITGANRSLWLRPCVIAGSIFFGAGLALMPIRGGHAKVKPSKTYTVYMK